MADFRQALGEAAGLLSTGNPMLDIGMGLLAQSGPVVGAPAPSLGQAFAGAGQFAQQREQGRLQTSAMRQAVNERAQRNEAMARLQGLLSGTTDIKTPATNNMLSPTGGSVGSNISQVPTINTPQGQNEMFGLLGQIAPEAMVQGLLAQQFGQQSQPRVDTALNTFDALYGSQYQQGTPEYAEAFNSWANQADPQKNAQLALLNVQLENALTEQEANATQKELDSLSSGIHGDTMINTVLEMSAANRTLKNSPLMTGVPMGQLRRAIAGGAAGLASLFGSSNGAELQELVDAYDVLERSSNSLVTQIATAPESGYSGAMASAIRAVTNSKGGISLSFGANEQFAESTLDELTRRFEAAGVPISPEVMEAARNEIERIRGENYAELSDEELLAIDPATLSGEQRAKLEREYDERQL